jgi:20S proteasome alpha/beta subunit
MLMKTQILNLAPMNFFKPEALLAGKTIDGTFCLYLITHDGWVYPIDNYHMIGSGYLLANLVINQQNRIPKSFGKRLADLELRYNVWIASYVINEVKTFDPYTGGNTKVVFIDTKGYNEIPDEKVTQYYNYTVQQIGSSFASLLENDKEIVNLFKSWYPRP